MYKALLVDQSHICRILRETVELMDARYKRMEWEKIAIIHIG